MAAMFSMLKKTRRETNRRRNSEDKEEKPNNPESTKLGPKKSRLGVSAAQQQGGEEESSAHKPKGKKPRSIVRRQEPPIPPEVEEACRDFIENHNNVVTILEEIKKLQQTTVGEHQRGTQEESRVRGQIPCLDATRVIVQQEEEGRSDFIHASRVHLNKDYILAQAPLAATVEDFWRMVFQEQSPGLLVLCTFYEEGRESSPCFWPIDAGAYKYYGKMFVNNKGVDTSQATTIYTLEILPEGCSNSLVTILYHYTAWDNATYNTSPKNLLNLRRQVRASESGPLTIISTEGIGRAASYTAIDVVLTRLFRGTRVRMLDVAMSLRRQRAHSLLYEMQYFFTITIVLHYIRFKIKKHEGAVETFNQQVYAKLKSSKDAPKD